MARPGRGDGTVGAWSAAVGAAVAGVVVAASSAFACSAIMGPISISPSSGPAGTTITTSASGLIVGATYAMHFGNTINSMCMSFKGVTTIATITADTAGAWNNVTMRVPNAASMGAHSFCGVETKPQKGSTGTQHMTFTVT